MFAHDVSRQLLMPKIDCIRIIVVQKTFVNKVIFGIVPVVCVCRVLPLTFFFPSDILTGEKG